MEQFHQVCALPSGGSISVGKASTNAVVTSSVLILFADLMLTKILA